MKPSKYYFKSSSIFQSLKIMNAKLGHIAAKGNQEKVGEKKKKQ